MKKWVTVTALGVALAVAGCGKSDDKAAGDKAAGGDAAPAAITDLVPGEYETKVEITKYEVAGMPAAAAEQMKTAAAKNAPSYKTCVTEANAKQMQEQMVRQAANAPEGCTVDNSSTGNVVNATITCTSPVALKSTMTGTPTDMTIKTETDAGGQKVIMEMNAKTTRIGDCAA